MGNLSEIRTLHGLPASGSFRIMAGGVLCVLLGLLAFCGKRGPADEADKILAEIGDLRITAGEFKYNFEFSLATLQQGPDPRRTFLDYLVREKLLAMEGYRRGYHQRPYVMRRMKQRRYLDHLEAFYQKYVHQRVQIPEEQIQEALKKGTVTWRMRIWPVPSLDAARDARAQAEAVGFSQYIQQELARQDVPIVDANYFSTEWIDFLGMKPEILEGIQDLEIGEISEPVPFDDGYALFQINDIRRSAIREDELRYGVKRKRMRDRLHNIQADSISHVLMDSVLTPMDIRVKGSVFKTLAPLLYLWIQDGLPSGQSLMEALEKPDSTRPYLDEIRNISGQKLVTCRGGEKTVADYIGYMDYFRRNLKRAGELEEFENRLITEIGRMMRNDTYVAIARDEGFADSVETRIRTDLQLWEEKWTYNAYRTDLVKDVDVQEDELKEWFSQHWRELDVAGVDSTRFDPYRTEAHSGLLHRKQMAVINRELDRLRQKYPVKIDEELMNRLDLLDDPETGHISVFVRNRFSNKPVVPTVDMKWINF